MWKRTWKTANSNAVNFHLLLTEGASKRAVRFGGERGSEYFFHEGEAVRIIREGLQGGTEDTTELFIMAIAHLISIAIMEGEPSAADMHMSAMLRIMAGRGGLSTFAGVPWRVIVWNDLRLAATQLRKPALPYCPRVVYNKLPPSLLQQARLLTLNTLPKLPTTLVSQIHPGAIQDFLYRIEYQLCSLTSKACGEHPIAPVVDALHLSAHTFAWTASHHSPITSKVQAKLLRQLHRVISETSDLISNWK
ncbi:hypothetical protein LTR66_003897 [Elasticomyces elasticus]|nr:hypothetical protein LTR66_003897 [Elasticomyces elasticus]